MEEAVKRDGVRRVGFFGGSFDPPHAGHLAVARAAREALALDELLFAPVGQQPLKLGLGAGYVDRCAMTRLAIQGESGFSLSLMDAPRANAAPNYTAETLETLRHELPQGGQLYCLMGADSFLALERWHRGAEIPFLAELIVASRPGEDLAPIAAHLPRGLKLLSPAPEKLHMGRLECWQIGEERGQRVAALNLLPGLHYEISASELRGELHGARMTARQNQRIIAETVLAYIRNHGLYA